MSSIDSTASDAEAWEAAAASLFGEGAKYIENVFTSWNGTDETERTFFDSNGAQLGDSRTNIDTWNNGTTDVTNTNTNYHGPDGEWLGNEYSNDQGEAGSFFMSTVAKLDSNGAVTQAWKDLAGELTWLVSETPTLGLSHLKVILKKMIP